MADVIRSPMLGTGPAVSAALGAQEEPGPSGVGTAIEVVVPAGDVDLAVHSSKDMPAVLPDGLEVGAVLPREDPRDAVVLPADQAAAMSFEEIVRKLGRAPRIGTSSIRRIAQLTRVFPGA